MQGIAFLMATAALFLGADEQVEASGSSEMSAQRRAEILVEHRGWHVDDGTLVILEGAICIETMSTGNLVVAVDVAPPDEIADYEIILGQEEPSLTASGYHRNATVVAGRETASVSAKAEGVGLVLFVEGAETQQTPEGWRAISGYGLSISWGGGFGVPIEVVASESYQSQGRTQPHEP